MRGTLFVVATPIGNLEDVTLRALRVLREVTVVAAEDTRRTARLLQHYSISTSTTSLHEHNEHVRTPNLIHRLLGGESIALVSDAGTPVISDPGTRLIAEAHRHSIRVEPIPGASAVIAALSASGIAGDGFIFAGFPPSRSKARKLWLQALVAEQRPIVFFEAPHRIRATVIDLAALFADRKVVIARELTKKHEELAVRPIRDWMVDPPVERGEFTLVIEPQPTGTRLTTTRPTDTQVASDFWQLTENGALDRRSAIREVSLRHGISSRDVFSALERQKKLGDQHK